MPKKPETRKVSTTWEALTGTHKRKGYSSAEHHHKYKSLKGKKK